MTAQDESNDQPRPGENANASAAKGSNRRLLLLIGLLALAVFALWYDYKVARPSVERAYDRITAKNDEINSASEHRRMTSADVQEVLRRGPSETFPAGKYMVEAYRWRAGMPIELRGLGGDESPGIGLKTFDYFAVYRKDGPELAFVTHFKYKLDKEYFTEQPIVGAADDNALALDGTGGDIPAPGGPGMSSAGPGGGAPGGGGPGDGFDPEAAFAERDTDGDGKLTGEEISERTRARLAAIDTDGDGAVSKEEFVTGRSQSGGGRGGAGGEGARGGRQGAGREGEGRRQRPPLEDGNDGEVVPAEATSSEVPPRAEPQAVGDEPATTAESSDATAE